MPICGGNWNNGSNAGVFNVNLNNPRSNANSHIGFRSALLSYARIRIVHELPDSAREIKESTSAPTVTVGEKQTLFVRGQGRTCGDKQNRMQLCKPQVAFAKAAINSAIKGRKA